MKVITRAYHDVMRVLTVLNAAEDEIAWVNTWLGIHPDMPPPSFIDVTEFEDFGIGPKPSGTMRYLVLRNQHGCPYITKENNPT